MTRRLVLRHALTGLASLALLAHAGAALAQPAAANYPSRPIRVILPLGPGSTTDVVARMFSERLGQRLGQTVIVDNKPGAG
ncbi:MAG: tripartite tricarboxylate transporter substrate binding protein, partial [Variovorax sp.]